MSVSHFVIRVVATSMILASVGIVSAQPYPNKPIRIVVSAAGGASDFDSRLVAQGISSSLGQQVIVDNRSGLLEEIVLRAAPDGYTLLADGSSMWLTPLIQKMPYDPMKDFSPITLMTTSPNVVTVHPAVAINSIKDLIAAAKAKPGELNYASAGVASSPHLAAELFKSMAGVNIVHVPYKGAGPAVIGLLGGQVQLMIGSTASVMPQIKAGKLRALAVTSGQPSPLVPGLPTVAASGLPGYEFVGMIGMWAPANTPAAIINRLNQEMVRVIRSPESKEKFLNTGLEPLATTPEEFAAKIKSEMARWGKVIKEAGIKAD